MTAVALVARLVLAAVFAVAGAAKLADRAGTRAAVGEFGVPARLAAPVAIALPLAELAVALLLLPAATALAGSAGAAALLGLFTAAIAVSLARGKAPDCHCFGQLHSAPAGPRTLLRNAALLGVAAVAAAGSATETPASALAWLGDLEAPEMLALVVAVVATALLAAGGTAFLTLMRSYGRVLTRLERVEAALAEAGIEVADDDAPRAGLEPGTKAPWFLAPTPDGAGRSLDDLLAPGLPLFLLFTSPHCGPCAELLPEAAEWQRDHADRLTVAFAASGDADAVAAEAAELELESVLVDEGGEIARSFGAEGTPAAVLVAADGTISTWVAGGRDEIDALLGQALGRGQADVGLPVGTEAPPLQLPSLAGDRVSLESLRGRDTVLLFWNPDCGYCRSMHERLLEWETTANGVTPRLVVVSSGDVEATRAEGFRSTVLVDAEYAAGTAFGAGGTPMAVLLDAEGRVASPVVAGADEVLALVGRHG